jgi:hypothetical protein
VKVARTRLAFTSCERADHEPWSYRDVLTLLVEEIAHRQPMQPTCLTRRAQFLFLKEQ